VPRGEIGNSREHGSFLISVWRMPTLIERYPLGGGLRELGDALDLRQSAVFVVPALNEKCRYA
jgi:hypothetical protein